MLLRRFLFSTNNIATTVIEIQVKKLLTHIVIRKWKFQSQFGNLGIVETVC